MLPLVMATFVPVQGFFDFLAYNRPRYLEHRKKNPGISFFRVVTERLLRKPIFANFRKASNVIVTNEESRPASNDGVVTDDNILENEDVYVDPSVGMCKTSGVLSLAMSRRMRYTIAEKKRPRYSER